MTWLTWCSRIVFALAIVAGLGVTAPSAASAAPTEVRRFVLVVGANDGGAERVRLRYAVDDAKAVAAVLGEVGGLQRADETVLADPTIPQLEQAIAAMAGKIRRARSGGANVQFLFYYSGHSDERGLLLGETRMEYRKLRDAIEAVPADVKLAVLDSCASGAFTRLKGGRKRAPFLVGNAADVKGHAFLTSSSADEVAQESDRVGGSYFTHFFTTGLRGAADADGDKQVTLSEAYEFAFDETLAQTEASRGGAQHAAYDINLTGAGDLVLTDLRRTTARLRLGSDIGGRVFVRRVGGELAAELYKPAGGGPVLLALVPGRYQVTVDDGSTLLRAETVVRAKEVSELEVDGLREIPREATRERGGVTTPEDEYVDIHTNVGLFPPVSINGQSKAHKEGKPIRNTFSFGAVWTESDAIDGAALSFGGSVVQDRVDGAQISMGVNVSNGHVKGAQVSQFANYSRSFRGVQSSFVNIAGTAQGAQVGFVNVSGDLSGAQIGFVDVGADVGGLQLGFFAFANSAKAQLALFSGTREFGVKPSVWSSDTGLVNVGLRFPAQRTYSEVMMGLHPVGSNAGWTFGLAWGVHNPIRNKMFVDIDLATLGVANGLEMQQPVGILMKLRLNVGWQPYDRLAVFGGPTFNVMGDRIGDEERDTVRVGYGWSTTVRRADNGRVRLWPGFQAGVRF